MLQTGGGSEIRTHDTLSDITVFKTVPFNHSGTPPIHQTIPKNNKKTRFIEQFQIKNNPKSQIFYIPLNTVMRAPMVFKRWAISSYPLLIEYTLRNTEVPFAANMAIRIIIAGRSAGGHTT